MRATLTDWSGNWVEWRWDRNGTEVTAVTDTPGDRQVTADDVADRVAAAFRAAPRAHFLPAPYRAHADLDQPLPIGRASTNSQPSTVRIMLELLDARPGQHVLDVGAGSGWTTALLAHLVGPDGDVLGLELDPDLAAWGAANLAAHRAACTPVSSAVAASAPARLQPADPTMLGFPAHAPYDRILVSAMATHVPEALVAQLADGGVLVVPVAGRMAVVRRAPRAPEPEVSLHGYFRFVPLVTPS